MQPVETDEQLSEHLKKLRAEMVKAHGKLKGDLDRVSCDFDTLFIEVTARTEAYFEGRLNEIEMYEKDIVERQRNDKSSNNK